MVLPIKEPNSTHAKSRTPTRPWPRDVGCHRASLCAAGPAATSLTGWKRTRHYFMSDGLVRLPGTPTVTMCLGTESPGTSNTV